MSSLAAFDAISLVCLALAMVAQFVDFGGRHKELLERWLLNAAFWGWLMCVAWLLVFHPAELESEASSLLHSLSAR